MLALSTSTERLVENQLGSSGNFFLRTKLQRPKDLIEQMENWVNTVNTERK